MARLLHREPLGPFCPRQVGEVSPPKSVRRHPPEPALATFLQQLVGTLQDRASSRLRTLLRSLPPPSSVGQT